MASEEQWVAFIAGIIAGACLWEGIGPLTKFLFQELVKYLSKTIKNMAIKFRKEM